jgi:L-arabinose transport system ATP-binding protein
MVGREISDIWGFRPRKAGEVRLKVDGLSGARLRTPASFEARAGEIVGFFGLIGAGRSELMRLVFGADSRSGGTITVDGNTVAAASPHDAIRAGIVLCSEDRKHDGIIQGRSIEENINISSRRHHTRFGVLSRASEIATAETFIKKLKVRTPSRRQDIVNLSGGNQQKVILGRGLLRQPKVLLLDDSMRGIDVRAKDEIYRLLTELADAGTSIILNSTEIPELIALCSRVLVFHDQAVFAELDAIDLSEASILRAMFGRTEEKAA